MFLLILAKDMAQSFYLSLIMHKILCLFLMLTLLGCSNPNKHLSESQNKINPLVEQAHLV